MNAVLVILALLVILGGIAAALYFLKGWECKKGESKCTEVPYTKALLFQLGTDEKSCNAKCGGPPEQHRASAAPCPDKYPNTTCGLGPQKRTGCIVNGAADKDVCGNVGPCSGYSDEDGCTSSVDGPVSPTCEAGPGRPGSVPCCTWCGQAQA